MECRSKASADRAHERVGGGVLRGRAGGDELGDPGERQVGPDDARLGPTQRRDCGEVSLAGAFEGAGQAETDAVRSAERFHLPSRSRLGRQHVDECRGPAIAPVPAVGSADHRGGVGLHERGGAPLVAGREGDGSLSDEAHGEDHRALDRQHHWVVGGEDGRGAIGVAEPGQLGGQLELGTGGVESVACLQVAVPQDRQTNTDLVDVAEQPGGAQSRLLEVQGHPTTGLISDRVERDQRSFEVPVAPVRNAAEPAQDGLPRLELSCLRRWPGP